MIYPALKKLKNYLKKKKKEAYNSNEQPNEIFSDVIPRQNN